MRTSASLPTYMIPFLGNILNIFAVLVDVTLTKSEGVIIPVSTPLDHITDSLSSIPLHPFGIYLKELTPILFCSIQKVQLSVAVVSKS